MGNVISDLARSALAGSEADGNRSRDHGAVISASRGGFHPFPSRGQVVTNELINLIRDAEGI